MSLRHRGLQRAATIAESPSIPQTQRRNSTLSDSVSEARNTIRSSTDELFFPRVATDHDVHARDEESHWHSAPLGLALLPAIAGIFFQNGSAFVTDVTLLALAAVFLNWSVRLPWEWYRSARTVRHQDSLYDPRETPVILETDLSEAQDTQEGETAQPHQKPPNNISTTAVKELQIHELAALASCFIFPLIGTWILHTIRSKLSRPSEGLVSNYNLTIFLLAAEIRPFSHLLKMVQARTLHLQRIIASDPSDPDKFDLSKIIDLSKRLEELEAHVAETAASRLNNTSPENDPRDLSPKETESTQTLISQATADYKRRFQADIDALNRAVRRYEKRTAVTSYQTESRLQVLEAKLRDALALAAAAQRSISQAQHSKGAFGLLFDWTGTMVLFPVQIGVSLVGLPFGIARWAVSRCRDLVLGSASSRAGGGAGRVSSTSNSSSNNSKGKSPQARRPASPQKKAKRTAVIDE
ncbi:hypothetical protein BDW59DRAFT_27784 [Aspergillus cavernicola]|uniref:Uncharacterized protein n=1 Tax=Aspergillus cavernicola TaxID=176166 RepID=A0ABR4HF77_9EURO